MPNDQLPPAVEQGFDDRYICKEHPREPKHYVDLEPEDVKQFLAQALATQERELLEWVRDKVEGLKKEQYPNPSFGSHGWYNQALEDIKAKLAQRRSSGERENAK